jgi:formate hydrogenlyase transcriptional activator
MRRFDGEYRRFLISASPLRDGSGRVVKWHGIASDIEDQIRAERLQNENIVLREEIDKVSMFEEIVGSSPPLLAALSRVEKVAATNSTVLITGETGTGKYLIARVSTTARLAPIAASGEPVHTRRERIEDVAEHFRHADSRKFR